MKYEQEKMAKAVLRDGAISFKTSIMIADTIRGMMSDKAQSLLVRVTEKKQPIKFTRFRDGAGHRSGFGAAKYPIKAAAAFLALVKQGVANAENKGLGTPLKITSVIANEASRPLRQGSARGHLMKRTHVEIILAETDESKKREKKQKKADKPKAETKDANAKSTTQSDEQSTPAEKKAEVKETPKSSDSQMKKQETESKPVKQEKPKAKEAQ